MLPLLLVRSHKCCSPLERERERGERERERASISIWQQPVPTYDLGVSKSCPVFWCLAFGVWVFGIGTAKTILFQRNPPSEIAAEGFRPV